MHHPSEAMALGYVSKAGELSCCRYYRRCVLTSPTMSESGPGFFPIDVYPATETSHQDGITIRRYGLMSKAVIAVQYRHGAESDEFA